MPRLERGAGRRLLTKACLSCGYRGASLQGRPRAVRCPSCGADLYTRPPRSYAEMEGFIPCSSASAGPYADDPVSSSETRVAAAKRLAVRVLVAALIITPPLVVVAMAGGLAALWIVRR